jgi:hypothetical protein
MKKRLLILSTLAALAGSLWRRRPARRVHEVSDADTEALRARMERARAELLRR